MRPGKLNRRCSIQSREAEQQRYWTVTCRYWTDLDHNSRLVLKRDGFRDRTRRPHRHTDLGRGERHRTLEISVREVVR